MHRILITEPVRTRQEFYDALGRLHMCGRPAPRNLDDLADFLRETHVRVILASDMELDDAAVAEVLRDLEVRLYR